MRRIVLLCVVLFGITLQATGKSVSYRVGIDWQMSVQCGIAYRVSEHIALDAGLGVSPMGLVTTECLVAYATELCTPPWALSLLFGIPNFNVPFTFDALMISIGSALEVSRKISSSYELALRIGAGFPLFFEHDKPMVRDIQFPLDIWPELSLSMRFP
jgi:hypothetical protein